MIDFGSRLEPKLLKDPLDLFFFAPHDVKFVSIGFLPLAGVEAFVDTVSERSLEFYILAV